MGATDPSGQNVVIAISRAARAGWQIGEMGNGAIEGALGQSLGGYISMTEPTKTVMTTPRRYRGIFGGLRKRPVNGCARLGPIAMTTFLGTAPKTQSESSRLEAGSKRYRDGSKYCQRECHIKFAMPA
jgi:hypothetical protein